MEGFCPAGRAAGSSSLRQGGDTTARRTMAFRTTRSREKPERGGNDRESDGQPVERVALGTAGRSDVENHEREREREQELNDQHLSGARERARRTAAVHRSRN